MGKIFIIDDDALQHRIVQLQVQKNNLFESVSFYEGQSAVNYLVENKDNVTNLPDYILLDINMPVMNAWQFLTIFDSLITSLKKAISIIIVSSSIDPVDKQKALAYPYVQEFISKPVNTDFFRNLANITGTIVTGKNSQPA